MPRKSCFQHVALRVMGPLVASGALTFMSVQGQTAMAEDQTHDDVTIQRQIDALREKGGVIALEAKTYVIRKAIVLYDNVTLEGAGMDRTILRLGDGFNQRIIRNENYNERKTPQGNHDIVIRNLTIDGNAANNPRGGEGIFLPNCYNYRIENVRVRNCRGFAGIYTNPCHQAARNKVKYKNYILNCIVEEQQAATDRDAPYGHGIYVTAWDNDNVLVKRCVVRNNRASGIHGEDGIAYLFVEENEVYGNKSNGIWFCEVRSSVIKRNRIHHNGGDGILMSQSGRNRNNLICENVIHHNGMNGIRVFNPYGEGGNNHIILRNWIWNNRHAAIYIHKTSARNTLAFNVCYNEAEDRPQGGIVVESQGNSIINNYLGANGQERIKAAKDNTLIEWSARIPLTPETLVGTYGAGVPLGPQAARLRGEPASAHTEEKPGHVFKVSSTEGDEIQKRIDALGEKGGIVQLSAGTYTITRAIVLRDYVTLQGEGMDKTVIRLADRANPKPARGRLSWVNRCVIRNENYDERKTPKGNRGITIRDLTIDGNAENNPQCGEGIFLATCYGYRVENVRVKNCRGFGGIYTNPSHWARGQKITYQNHIVNCIVENNRSALDRDAPYGHGIYVTAWDNDNVLIKGNICRNNAGSGINLEDGIQHICVEDNECYGNRQYGIWMVGVNRSIVTNNRLHHNLRGIHLVHSSTDLVYGNEIYENALEGIYVGEWGFKKHAADRSKLQGTHHIIVGNLVRSNNRHYMDAGSGIYVDTRFNTLAFNFVYDDKRDKTQFIAIIAYAPDNVVVNNWFGPAAYYRSGATLVNMAGKNIYVPWEREKPWQVNDLVSRP